MNPPNITILTGNDNRHKYFIDCLSSKFIISEIYLENGNYPCPEPKSEDESLAWKWFFQNRDRCEEKLIQQSSQLKTKNKPKVTHINEKDLNAPETIAKIIKTNPGFIAVFGTGILSNDYLKLFPNRLYNLHIGDPQYYRGSSCNFWPVYEGKLQHLSATVHRIDQNIDTGNILNKQTVTLNKLVDDQTLLIKPLILGTQLMIKTIQQWLNDALQPEPQITSGPLYKRSEFTPEIVLKYKQMVESGRLNNRIQAKINSLSSS